MKKCINCGKEELNNNVLNCSACGSALKKINGTICPYCNTEIAKGMNFCPGCGASVPGCAIEVAPYTPVSVKKKRGGLIALIIVLIIALMGACISGTVWYMNNNTATKSVNNDDDEKKDSELEDVEVNDEKWDSELAEIKSKGKLVIGYTIYEPMNYEENGNFVGFDTELAEAVCKRLGVEAEFVEIDWSVKFDILNSGEIDCIWNGLSITEEYKEICDFSNPYAKTSQVVVMREDQISKYPNMELLGGLIIAVEEGSAGEYALIEYGLDANMISMASQGSALSAVATEMADACVIDCSLANNLAELGAPYEEFGYSIELAKEEYGIGFRKSSDLKTEIDKIINELKNDGTLYKLSERYGLSLID